MAESIAGRIGGSRTARSARALRLLAALTLVAVVSTAPRPAGATVSPGATKGPSGEMAGPADDAATPAGIPGSGGFNTLVVDAAHGLVAVALQDTVSLYDLDGGLVKSFPGQAGVAGMVVLGQRLYVTQWFAGAVTAIDLDTLQDLGVVVDGIVQPRQIATTNGTLYVASGPCGQWAGTLTRVDPLQRTTSTFPLGTYCPTVAASPAEQGIVYTSDTGISTVGIVRWNMDGPTPKVEAQGSTDGAYLKQLTFSPDGASIYTASGAPARISRYRSRDIIDTGVQFPTGPYPTAVAATPMLGGLVAAGTNGTYDPDLYVFRSTYPYSELASYDFGSPQATVLPGGLAFGPDGRRLYAVIGEQFGPPPSLVVVDPLHRPAGGYHPVAPARLLDTREGPEAPSAIGAGATRRLQVAGRGGVPDSGASAVVLNVTVDGPTAPGFVALGPAGGGRPGVSNLNFVAGQTVANAATVPLGEDGAIDIFNLTGDTDVVVDVQGWYDDDGAGSPLEPTVPMRVLDTRQDPAGPLRPAEVRRLPLAGAPADAVAVAVNLTVTEPTSSGFLTAWPSGSPRPWASNLNFVPGQTRPNFAVVSLGASASIDLFNSTGRTHAVVDVLGWYTAAGTAGLRFVPMEPTRMLDTRRGGGQIQPATDLRVDLGSALPRVAGAVVLNVTNAGSTAPGYLTVHPGGSAPPVASTLNWIPGEINPNLAVAELADDGTVAFYNAFGRTDLVVDVFGYFRS